MKRKIAVVTGTRADYGILRPLLHEIKNNSSATLKIIATGSHLSPEFGLTYREIEADGFTIDKKIKILFSSDTPMSLSKSMALALAGFAEAFARIKPDIVVVLGDRYEVLAAACAATVARIPIAHIHGGERSEGVIDECFRHAITKMSHLHFPAAEEYRRRIIQMGEQPSTVYNVGALALDSIRSLKLLSRKELENQLDTTFDQHNLLITFHPPTLDSNVSKRQFTALLTALETLRSTRCIFTYANADVEGRIINRCIDRFVAANPKRAIAFPSLGHLRYLSLLQFVDAVVGNSSSGIIEAPSFKIGTINIGDRQRGRIRAESIIDCAPTTAGIRAALTFLYSPSFQGKLQEVVNPYGSGGAAKKITDILKRKDCIKTMKKSFFDVSLK